jgi:putative ABC transport system permease protein
MVHPFRRNRALTAAVIVTISLGVGVSAAMFNLVDVLLFRPPAHVVDADRLVEVPSANNFVRHARLQRRVQSLDLAAYNRVSVAMGRDLDGSVLRAECVTGNYFSVLGVTPIVGPGFADQKSPSDGTPPVILSYGLWTRFFDRAPDVLTSSVELGGTRHTVVGVAPPDFTGVRLEPADLWLALAHSPDLCSPFGRSLLTSSSSAWLTTIGRIRNSFTLEQAAAETSASDTDAFGAVAAPEIALRPLASSRRARLTQDGRMALWLTGGALLVLLIACANVAVLLALRAWERRLEVAMRIQLGATALRVFRLFFLENLVFAVVCIGGAAVIALWVDRAIRAFFPVLTGAHLNGRSLAIIAAFALFAGLAGGIVPAVQIARSNASVLLRGGQQVIAGGSRTRTVLLVLQLALAHVLLVGTGLFTQSVNNLLTGAGYDIEQIIVATVELEKQGYAVSDAWSKIDTFVEQARSMPAVVSVGVSSDALLKSGGMTVGVGLRSSLRPNEYSATGQTQSMNAVTIDYFKTLGTRVLRGRSFVPGDDRNAPPVVMIDEGLARAAWPGQDPLGQCAYIGSRADCIEVVGITETRRSTFLSRERKEFFVPVAQAPAYGLHSAPRTLFIRTSAPVRNVMPALLSVLQSVIPEIPKSNVRPLLDLADADTKSWRLGAKLFGLFGVSAAIMVGVGIYAALALMVRQRTSELAVRMVLGATPGTVVRMIVRHVAILTASGWLLGAEMVLLAGRFFDGLLFGVKSTEPTITAEVACLLCAVAALGCLLPGIRAARLDPSAALRG